MTISKNLNYQLVNSLLGIDVAWTFKKKFKNRWHLYSGMGVSALTTVSSHSQATYTDGFYYESQDESFFYYKSNSNQTRETLEGEKVNNFSLYILFGIEFQLGKDKREILRHLHLCLEIRPSLHFHQIQGYQTVSIPGIMNQIGLRFSL